MIVEIQKIKINIPNFGEVVVCRNIDDNSIKPISIEGSSFLDTKEHETIKCCCRKNPVGYDFVVGEICDAEVDAFNVVVHSATDIFVVCKDEAYKYFDVPIGKKIDLPYLLAEQRLALIKDLNVLFTLVLDKDSGAVQHVQAVASIVQNSTPILASGLIMVVENLDWLEKYGDRAVQMEANAVRKRLMSFLKAETPKIGVNDICSREVKFTTIG